MSVVPVSNTIKSNGHMLYKTNTTMRDIATIMEHPEFKDFFGKYFNDSTDVQAMLLMMKVYQAIPSDDPFEKIAVLHEAMQTSDVRTMIMDSFKNWRLMDTSNEPNHQTNQLTDNPVCHQLTNSHPKQTYFSDLNPNKLIESTSIDVSTFVPIYEAGQRLVNKSNKSNQCIGKSTDAAYRTKFKPKMQEACINWNPIDYQRYNYGTVYPIRQTCITEN